MTPGRRNAAWVALGLAISTVMSLIVMGPRVGAFALLDALPPAESLDYGSRVGGLAPLSSRYIASVLGAEVTENVVGARPAASSRHSFVPRDVAARVTDVHLLTNDDIADARTVPSVPFTAKTDTRGATHGSDDPGDCSAVASSTVWYRYTPKRNIGLVADTFGSNYATAIGVFSGEPGSLERIACDSDGRGNAIVPFPAKKKVTYYFQIVGPTGGGDLVFNLDPHGVTTLASIGPSGEQARLAGGATMSANGRFVAFDAVVSEYAACDIACEQVFIRDRSLNRTTLVSADPSGGPANSFSAWAYISGNGRYVAFASDATNLVEGDDNLAVDVFVRDLDKQTTERVSVTSSGESPRPPEPMPEIGCGAFPPFSPGGSCRPSLSHDGRYVAFMSNAALVPEDHNNDFDAYVHDRLTKKTERVSVSSDEEERDVQTHFVVAPRCPTCPEISNNDYAGHISPLISPNGRYVLFLSPSTNLVPNDTDGLADYFVRDRIAGTTETVSIDPEGKGAPVRFAVSEDLVPRQAFSFDGRYVTYVTRRIVGTSPGDIEVFRYDQATRRTTRLVRCACQDSTNIRGVNLSADGRHLAFYSNAADLVSGDEDGAFDVFIQDLTTRNRLLISLADTGEPKDEDAVNAFMSADGQSVVYVQGGSSVGVGLLSVSTLTAEPSSIYILDRPRGRL